MEGEETKKRKRNRKKKGSGKGGGREVGKGKKINEIRKKLRLKNGRRGNEQEVKEQKKEEMEIMTTK